VIAFSHISKQYGKQVLFVDASFQLNPGEKVGLVGPNGSGKTTLFRMITGEEQPDEGDVSVPRKTSIGYFRQDVEEMSGRSVLDEAIAGSGRLGTLHHELEELQQALADLFGIRPTIVCVVREARDTVEEPTLLEIVDDEDPPSDEEALRRVKEMFGAQVTADASEPGD